MQSRAISCPAITGSANTPIRFRHLEVRTIHGFTVPVADHGISRRLALRALHRPRCPDGLLIPNTNRTHTFGMRFDLDLLFMDSDWRPLIAVREVHPGHRVQVPEAAHLLLLPSDWDIEKWEEAVTRGSNPR